MQVGKAAALSLLAGSVKVLPLWMNWLKLDTVQGLTSLLNLQPSD